MSVVVDLLLVVMCLRYFVGISGMLKVVHVICPICVSCLGLVGVVVKDVRTRLQGC